jgi:trehalose 6-phosphate synthase
VPEPTRLIIVANRLPVQLVRAGRGSSGGWERSAGGLVTALEPILKKTGGAWIGWTGAPGRTPRASTYQTINIRPIALPAAEVEGFYHGFSNSTIWPLYHYAIRTPQFHRPWWARYVEVNRRFARAAARTARKGDTVWIHDYHLQLVPRLLRELRPDLRIGFFLHTPFPPEELFAWLPWRQQILTGLLGADLAGFQTYADAQNFSRAARRYAGAEGTDTRLQLEGRTTRVGAFPISIDFKDFETAAARPAVAKAAQRMRDRIGSTRKLILAVDRLDYTKGIDVRLRAFEELLEDGSVDDTVMIQIATPSRERVEHYQRLRAEVEQAVGRINGTYSRVGHPVLHYLHQSLPREELAAFFAAADVMLVTPLRDGMNLVAKEYVASRPDLGGVLVLSEFTGAAAELKDALLVNPHDIDGLKDAMLRAKDMPAPEAKKRMRSMRRQVLGNDVNDWSEAFLRDLARTRPGTTEEEEQ